MRSRIDGRRSTYGDGHYDDIGEFGVKWWVGPIAACLLKRDIDRTRHQFIHLRYVPIADRLRHSTQTVCERQIVLCICR